MSLGNQSFNRPQMLGEQMRSETPTSTPIPPAPPPPSIDATNVAPIDPRLQRYFTQPRDYYNEIGAA